MNVIDHGENDPLPFVLGSWQAVAEATKKHIEKTTGRELTDVDDIPVNEALEIQCFICAKKGVVTDIHQNGWCLARNMPFTHLCTDCRKAEHSQ